MVIKANKAGWVTVICENKHICRNELENELKIFKDDGGRGK